MRKIICDSKKCNNKVLEYGLFDGYSVGDRLLEGVNFRVSFDNQNKTNVIINPESADYFSQFNAELWYEQVRDHIDNTGDILECPHCGWDAYIDNK